jgi:hypothetical protein
LLLQYADDTELARELGLGLVRHIGFHAQDLASRAAEVFAEGRTLGCAFAALASLYRHRSIR